MLGDTSGKNYTQINSKIFLRGEIKNEVINENLDRC